MPAEAVRHPHRLRTHNGVVSENGSQSTLSRFTVPLLPRPYTNTAGFTDHVFALMHLLGFRFAPRIRDLGDTKLYIPKGGTGYDALKPMIGGTLNIKHVRAHWDEILRLATSINRVR